MEGFHRFLDLIGAENGALVNYSNISRATGVTPNTVKEYFAILVDTLIAYEIPPWFYSTGKQLQKSSKYYLFDNGIVTVLTGNLNAELKPATYLYGKLFENFVVTEFIRQQKRYYSDVKIYNYREQKGAEIDLILQKNPYTNPVAVEIKSSSSPSIKDAKRLIRFLKDYPKCKAILLCNIDKPYVENNIDFLPFTDGITKALQYA